jgi:NADH-quinone oxidoreductase subunit I
MRIWGTGLLNGLRISMVNLFRGPITVQYPRQRQELPERARWAVVPKYDEAGVAKCTACTNCVRACPDYVLDLQVTTDPETKAKHIDHFSYQVGACMMCGLCVEVCPFDALDMGHDYELARIDPNDLEYDLLTDVPAYVPKRPERPVAPARPAVETAPAPAAPAETTEAPAAEAPATPAVETPEPTAEGGEHE